MQLGKSSSFLLRASRGPLRPSELSQWFEALHPLKYTTASPWSQGHHAGKELLRKTAWWVAAPCTCSYSYADTCQPPVQDTKFKELVATITERIAAVCGLEGTPPNSCNLNYYPEGGGVGWHADSEPIFGSDADEKLIISLSLSSSPATGKRHFDIRRCGHSSTGCGTCYSVELAHGDLVTMQGMFQTEWQHSIWPGDDECTRETASSAANRRTALGERINLTFRWVTRHNIGCAAAHQVLRQRL